VGILSEGRFFKMKKYKVFLLLGMLVSTLAIGLVLVGCDTGTGGDGTGTENTGDNDNNTGDGTTKIPSAPTGVRVERTGPTGIRLTWDTVSGATSYNVYYTTGSSSLKNLRGTTGSPGYNITGLEPNTGYTCYITAANSAGESGYSSPVYAKTLPRE
jgi:hypothetical protein